MSLFGMLENFTARQTFFDKLRQIIASADPRPAYVSGASGCQRSGVCCWRRPCDLVPGDVERLAAHLGITPAETFLEYLVVDEFGGELRLLPRRGQQAGGHYLTTRETYQIDTPCVFLDGKTCRVHDAKPTGGARWHCAMSEAETRSLIASDPKWTHAELVALGWDGETE